MLNVKPSRRAWRTWAWGALWLAGCATAPVKPAAEPASNPSAAPVAQQVSRPALTPVPVVVAPPVPLPAAPVLGAVTFVATGDIMAHGAVKEAALAADGGWDALLAPVAPIVGPADVAFGNLETPVAPDHDHGSRSFVFNAPPAMLTALKKVGFDVVLFANNHVYDQGRDGFTESLPRIAASGLKEVGAGATRAAAEAPLMLTVHGVKLAWFGAAQFFNDPKNVDDPTQPYANLLDPKALAAAIEAVRPKVDAVLVSVHWGVEYMQAPRQSEVEIAHQLFEAGADVIIGSHPHVLQPMEVYRANDGRTCLCMYSLGNFISNQSRKYVAHVQSDKTGDPRDAVFVRFTLEKRDYGQGGTAVDVANVSMVPLWTANNFYRPKHTPPDIHPEVIDTALARDAAELKALQAAPGEPSKQTRARIVALKREVSLLTLRRARIVSRLGEDFATSPGGD